MWVQELELGEALDRRELERLLRTAYELVKAKLPKRARPGAAALPAPRRPRSAAAATRGRRR